MDLNTSGIYQILNTLNNKYYIGSAVNVQKRWNLHLMFLRKGRHHSRYLQRAFNKSGEVAFSITIIERVEASRSILLSREQFYLDTMQPFGSRGYNACRTAGSVLGIKRSPEVREKIRQAKLGKPSWNKGKKRPPFSDEWKRNLARPGTSNPFYGKRHSDASRDLISQKAKARLADPTRNFFYDKHLTGDQNGMYGRTHTAEARERIGAAHKGKTLSPSHIEKLRELGKTRRTIAVVQLDSDGMVVAQYISMSEAARDVGTTTANILRAVQNPTQRAKGRHWRLAA